MIKGKKGMIFHFVAFVVGAKFNLRAVGAWTPI
jgi:hypothetical protein